MIERSLRQPMIRLREALSRYALSQGVVGTPIPDLSFVRRDAPSRPVQGTYRPLLCVIAQGAKRVLVGQSATSYFAGDMVLTAVELPTVGQVIKASKKEPFLAASLELDLALIAELMLLTREQVSTDESAVPGLGCAVAPAAIIDALDRMIRLIEAPHEIPILLPGIKREIHYRLLACPIGHLLRQFWGLGASHASIAQLVSRIKNNPSEVLHIPNIAQQVGMSAATLHRKFKIITGLSPIRFQKRIRLLEARRRLLANAATASQAAYSVGYESVPQFTREYGRLFGSSPLQDKLRAQADFLRNSQAN